MSEKIVLANDVEMLEVTKTEQIPRDEVKRQLDFYTVHVEQLTNSLAEAQAKKTYWQEQLNKFKPEVVEDQVI